MTEQTFTIEPEFKPEDRGQVYYYGEPSADNSADYPYELYPYSVWKPVRQLNQTEVGPDWVPKAEFVKLLDALSYYKSSKVINEVLASLPEDLREIK